LIFSYFVGGKKSEKRHFLILFDHTEREKSKRITLFFKNENSLQ